MGGEGGGLALRGSIQKSRSKLPGAQYFPKGLFTWYASAFVTIVADAGPLLRPRVRFVCEHLYTTLFV